MKADRARAPRVSVGLPVYNGARFLAAALESLLGQTFADLELIVADNASTDGTDEIVRAFAARDRRIRAYRWGRNHGAAWNYNRVFALARGAYFKWAAHDDLCAPELLERLVSVLDGEPGTVVAYPRTAIIDEAGRFVAMYGDGLDLREPDPGARYRRYHDRFRFGGECNAIFGLLRASALRATARIGAYPASDTVLLGELALRGGFHEVQEPLFLRRDHADTSVRRHEAFDARAVWFDPRNGGRVQLPRWRWLVEHLAAVRRAPIGAAVRARCLVQVAKWAAWNRQGLWRDIEAAARWLAGRRRGRRGGEGGGGGGGGDGGRKRWAGRRRKAEATDTGTGAGVGAGTGTGTGVGVGVGTGTDTGTGVGETQPWGAKRTHETRAEAARPSESSRSS